MKNKLIYLTSGLVCGLLLGCSVNNADAPERAQNNTEIISNDINNVLENYYNSFSKTVAEKNIKVVMASDVNKEDKPIIAEFYTEFKNATKSRAHNIIIAASKIDEKVIMPGEEFSFNDTIGPTTKKNGFMLGRIFVNGKDSKGYGGGVCQVSSTLYNAVEMADMKITERHDHSKAVNYVKKGKDAATSYGSIDFKFVNNKPYPVKVNSFIDKEKIVVSLMELDLNKQENSKNYI